MDCSNTPKMHAWVNNEIVECVIQGWRSSYMIRRTGAQLDESTNQNHDRRREDRNNLLRKAETVSKSSLALAKGTGHLRRSVRQKSRLPYPQPPTRHNCRIHHTPSAGGISSSWYYGYYRLFNPSCEPRGESLSRFQQPCSRVGHG